MGEYGIELAGWMATLEGGSPFTRRWTSTTVLTARAQTLRHDIKVLEDQGVSSVGVQAGRDLLAMLEKALE